MTDYSTLTNEALRRLIAERLGWREIEVIRYWEDDYYDTREVTALEGLRDGDRRLLPDWPEDANAIDELLGDLYEVSGQQKFGDRLWFCKLQDDTGAYEAHSTVSRKHARLLAWLAWKDATDGA